VQRRETTPAGTPFGNSLGWVTGGMFIRQLCKDTGDDVFVAVTQPAVELFFLRCSTAFFGPRETDIFCSN
jgi:hypothetical protein